MRDTYLLILYSMKTFSTMTKTQKSKLTIYEKEEMMKKIILVAIEEQFRRTRGAKYYWLQFIASSRPVQEAIRDVLELNINSRQDHTHLFHFVSYAIANHSLYSTIRAYDMNTINYYQFIQRASKYAHVTDYFSFMQQMCSHPEGVLVNQQLLTYTYDNIEIDIKASIKKMDLIKIPHSDPQTTTYFLFPNLVAKNYNILLSKNEANIRKSMIKQICRQINENQIQTIEQPKRKYELIDQQYGKHDKWDTNYQLSYFSENKKRWLLFNEKKDRGEKSSFSFVQDNKDTQNAMNRNESWQSMMMEEDMRMFGPYDFNFNQNKPVSARKIQNVIESKSDPQQSRNLTDMSQNQVKIEAQSSGNAHCSAQISLKPKSSKRKSAKRQIVNLQDQN